MRQPWARRAKPLRGSRPRSRWSRCLARLPKPGVSRRRRLRTATRRRSCSALASRIAAAGFDDFLIVAEGAEAGSIALGRFSTPEAAGRRQQALRDAGFASQVHPLGGNTDWLLLALPDGQPLAAARAALSALQAQSHPCPD